MANLKVLIGAVSIAALGVAGLILANWDRGVTVVLRNVDSADLLDVKIHVTGRDYGIGDMPSGSKRHVQVDPTGASHIEISQQLADRRGRVPVQCYFEAGYSGSIEIELTRASASVLANEIAVGIW